MKEYVELRNGDKSDRRIFFVSKPAITAYVPGVGHHWPCILILPGGGFQHVAIDKEGHHIARWLLKYDIASAVLEYRMPQRDDKIFLPEISSGDVKRALELVYERATSWGLDAEKIGVMGFSAGGYLASKLSNQKDLKYRPQFQILVYPFAAPFRQDTEAIRRANRQLFGPEFSRDVLEQNSPEKHINSNTPPTFIVHALDDEKVPVGHSMALYQQLLMASVPAEMHLYDHGGHGFAMRALSGSLKAWPDQLIAWLRGSVL
ncbi:MAG: alpha/beta hydrolase [Myxococcales bacterium]|nr:MAG: alpha/beta hydrolase [Myxococcales bacterium]